MSEDGAGRVSRGKLAVVVLLAAVFTTGFAALGVWQIERRAWKLDLIARVDARAHSDPTPAPGSADWPRVSADTAEYRRVSLSGVFDNDRETPVQAVSDYGAGFWILTPLKLDRGFTVLVNRGFVPPDRKDRASRPEGQPAGPVTVTGLMRITEPKGAFLRANDAEGDVWRSRDVAAIAEKRGVEGPVAPYFVDADATPNPGGLPIGGLTIIAFRNNHLVYALTWFSLAVGTLVAAWLVLRRDGGREVR